MKKLILLLLFIPLLSFSQGLLPSSITKYENLKSVEFDEQFGLTESVPEFFSLEKYVPNVLMQEGNSCTGFSIFYYGLSTQYNIELNITNSIDKTGHSFDPYFGYTIVNDKNYESSKECDATNTMMQVLDILKTNGAKKQFFTPHIECNSSSNTLLSSEINNYTNPYEIFDYEKIPGVGFNMSINSTKEQLLDNKPVLLSAYFPNNFQYNVLNSGEFSPSDFELNSIKNILSRRNSNLTKNEVSEFLRNNFGHAVTIVGYDDNIHGGAFRVVNSWGNEWGDEGYFWLKYKDFKILTFEAYVIDLLEDISYENDIQFRSVDYIRIKYEDGSTYEGQYVNDMFNGKGIYSYDSDNGRVNVIGNWKNNVMDGFFTIVNSNNELYYGVYENGEYVEDNSYGLTDDDDEVKKNKEKFLEYWEKHGGKKKIRKSRSIIIKQRNVT